MTRERGRRRAWVVPIVAVAMMAPVALPVQAATIPTPPAECVTPSSTPVVDGVTIAPRSVDTSSGAKVVTVSVRAHDTVAISDVWVWLTLARSSSVMLTKIEGAEAALTLSSGSATSGSWSGKVTIPRWGRLGDWVIEGLLVVDVDGGVAAYAPGQTGYATPWREVEWGAGWDSRIAVTGRHDTTAPTVTGFRSGARAVDARARAVPVAFSVTVRDRQSGLDSVVVKMSGTGTVATLRRSSGNTWTGRMTISRWAGSGQWRMTVVARDRAGNRRTLTPAALSERGWQSRLTVRSGRDAVGPRLVSMSFPAEVDTTSGPVRVPVVVRVSDAGSGVVATPELAFGPGAGVAISGNPMFRVSHVTGTVHDRTFHGYIDLPQCAQPEEWYPSLEVTDAAGNPSLYFPPQLVPPLTSHASMRYRALDGQPPTGFPTASGNPPSQVVDIHFTEPTLFDRDPALAISVTTASGTKVPGTWSCLNAAGTVPCQDDGADVTTLRFAPATQPTSRARWTVRYLGSYPDIGIYDRVGNPAQPVTFTVAVGPGAGYGSFVRPDLHRAGMALPRTLPGRPISSGWQVPTQRSDVVAMLITRLRGGRESWPVVRSGF